MSARRNDADRRLYGSDASADQDAEMAALAAREEAEGIELFVDPDSDIPVEALAEGAPGHESLSGDDLGLTHEDNHREEAR